MERVYHLIREAQRGDEKAKKEIVEENSGLIWSVVKRFQGRGEMEDLYQIGAIGLLKCIEKFDFSYEVKFSTYAVPMIMGEIRRYLRDDGSIKISRGLKELSYRISKLQEQTIKEYGMELSVSEIARSLNAEVEEVVLAIEAGKDVESLNSKRISKDETDTGINRIAGADSGEKMLESIILKEELSHLDIKERQIIFLRYFKDETQTEVARKIGISQVQVSRIEKKVLQKMKNNLQ